MLAESISPAKCILFGEHAVVYGEPGIASPLLSCKANAKAYPYDKGFLKLESNLGKTEEEVKEYKELGKWLNEKWEECYKAKDFSELFSYTKKQPEKTWLSVLSYYFNLPEDFSAYIKTSSSIPIGSGLGSSAALSSAIAKCLAKLIGENEREKIFNACLLCEKMFHGTPSGIDSAITCYEKPLLFRKSYGFDFFEIKPLEIFLIYTHKPEKTTGELVQKVRNLSEDYREPRIRKIGKITLEAKKALENGEKQKIIYYMKENQLLLKELGVSSEEIDRVTGKINEEKDMAAKLSGAGGGGIVIALAENKEKLEKILEELGYEKIEKPELILKNKTYWEERLA